MQSLYFLLYMAFVLVFFIIYSILKCIYKLNFLDSFLYTDNTSNNISKIIAYYISHFLIYFIFGLLFSFDIFSAMTIKTVSIELILIAIKNCSLTSFDHIESAIISIFVGMVSYIIGSIIRMIYDNMKNKNKLN